MTREEILRECGMSNQKPIAFNYNDYLKVMEENAALQEQLARVTAERDGYRDTLDSANQTNASLAKKALQIQAERDAAIKDCSGWCETCAFVHDCAKHDNNDVGPAVWHWNCEDWQWRGMIDTAIEALHAQEEAEKNEPLTLSELLQMGGEPVWIDDFTWKKAGLWGLVSRFRQQSTGKLYVYVYNAQQGERIYSSQEYEKYWLAYRHKKEEADHETD